MLLFGREIYPLKKRLRPEQLCNEREHHPGTDFVWTKCWRLIFVGCSMGVTALRGQFFVVGGIFGRMMINITQNVKGKQTCIERERTPGGSPSRKLKQINKNHLEQADNP